MGRWERFHPALRARLLARIADAPDDAALLRHARLLRVLERLNRDRPRRGSSQDPPPARTR